MEKQIKYTEYPSPVVEDEVTLKRRQLYHDKARKAIIHEIAKTVSLRGIDYARIEQLAANMQLVADLQMQMREELRQMVTDAIERR